jgi:hypothetical protein
MLESFLKEHGKKYFIENAFRALYLDDIIRINPTLPYLLKDLKKGKDGCLLYPGGYAIMKILNKENCIPKNGSGMVIVVDANKTYDIEVTEKEILNKENYIPKKGSGMAIVGTTDEKELYSGIVECKITRRQENF